MKYVCRGDDHEDLTEQVYKAIRSKPEPRATFSTFFSKLNKKTYKWCVVVTCSQGHENTFEGESSKLPKGDVAAEVDI